MKKTKRKTSRKIDRKRIQGRNQALNHANDIIAKLRAEIATFDQLMRDQRARAFAEVDIYVKASKEWERRYRAVLEKIPKSNRRRIMNRLEGGRIHGNA